MFKANVFVVVGALFCAAAAMPASAQQVHKCASRKSVTYSDKGCAGRVVNTDAAPVAVKPGDLRRKEQQRLLAAATRPRPGETSAQFETRRRRTRLPAADTAECERIDKRIPVEQASLTNPDPAEVAQAQAALRESSRRSGELRC